MTGRRWVRAGLGCVLVAVLGLTSGCVKAGISPKAHETHDLFYIVLWLALPVFLFVEGMLVFCLIKYRKRPGDDTPPIQDYGRNKAWMAFFGGPLLIVVILLAFGDRTLSDVDHLAAHPDNKITVTGFQWEWQASYPQGFQVTGKTLKSAMLMELPVNQTTQITLKSLDVIHEFYVPDLLFMKNAVPGHPNTFSIKPTQLGTFKGQCAQYCGLWHSQMRFTVKVVTPTAYKAWVKHNLAATSKAKSKTCASSGDDIKVTAHNIQWDTSCLTVEGGEQLHVTIDNLDGGVAHNFAVWQSSKLKHQFWVTPNVTGPATKTFTMPALKPGRYYFQCNIHGPAMSGTLIVTKDDDSTKESTESD